MVVQATPQSKPLSLQLPQELTLRVTLEQFVMLAAANRELRLERTATGELNCESSHRWQYGFIVT